MSGSKLPTKVQLTESCNQVEVLFDALNDHTRITLTTRSRILFPVKNLFTSLQRLEDDEKRADGAFYTADPRSRYHLARVLVKCNDFAKQLRERIGSNTLRPHDAIELKTMTEDIDEFMKLPKKHVPPIARPKTDTTLDPSVLVEDLLRKQRNHQSEVEGLETELHDLYGRERTFEQEIATLNDKVAARDQSITDLENQNSAKLSHIRGLHAAIWTLGFIFEMPHHAHEWQELIGEFPAMKQRIEDVNARLKQLELERDHSLAQERDSEEESVAGEGPSVPRAPSAVNRSKVSVSPKERGARRKDHRRTSDAKPSTKARSPSPASSEASRANTSKSRRKSRNGNTGSGFFFGA